MAKKTLTNKEVAKSKNNSKTQQEEDDNFDEELSHLDSDVDDDDDFFPDENDYEPEIDPDEIPDVEEDLSTTKRKASNSCQREGYCTRCDGDHSEPMGLCTCRCHDIC